MQPLLRLYEDILPNDATLTLAPAPRMIFVVHGSLRIDGHAVESGEAWHGAGAVEAEAGPEGVACWRWDLVPEANDRAVASPPGLTREKLSAHLETLPAGDLLMRGDSVAFPPGGCAYLHTHQGPGIRCLIEGGIRIDTHGRSTSYGPGCAWYESGQYRIFVDAPISL
jgi:hypothetical protein